MAENTPSALRISPATLALGTAALLAAAAVAIAIFSPGDRVDAAASAGNNATAAQAGTLEDSIASLNAELRRDPDNHDNWFLLGMALREKGSFAEAAQAFRRAMELSPQEPKYYTYLGEMLLVQGDDSGAPEAERLFRRALELQPGNPASRFYLATLKDSSGDHRAAVDELIQLLREAPPGAPWEPQVRQAVTAIAAENRIDIADRLPPPQAAPAAATAAIPGPTREQIEAARGIPPSQQDAMVQGMVERLAARLRQNPRDADGWIRLMRSRMVLNEPDAARDALRSGLAAFPDDTATQQRLRTAASELGVPAG